MLKIFLISLLFFVNIIYANNLPIYGKVYISNYSSKSSELVYNPATNQKISELIWKIDNLPLLGFAIQIPSKKKFKFNLNYQTKFTNTKAQMDDYDWLKSYTTDWSDWSTHPNTKIVSTSIIDINLQYNLKDDKYGNSYILYAGYKIEEHSFEAYDGSYTYTNRDSNNPVDFRKELGSITGLGITYEEKFKSFYLKGLFLKEMDRFLLKGSFTYSPFVIASNKDNHHFRSFINTNSYNYSSMYEIGLGLNYYIRTNIAIGFDYVIRVYDEARGTTSRTYYANNATDGATAGDTSIYSGAGIKSEVNSMTNLKVIFKF